MRLPPLIALCLLLCSAPGCQKANEYPHRPITLICPWAAGGGTDRVSRQMAFFLEHELKVPVNVINATGGGGVTGHSRGLHATADGYTITMMTVEINMLHWRDLTKISWRDSHPLASINADAAAVFVRNDSPWKSIDDLADAIRASPGKLTASGTSTGGIWHLGLSGFLQSLGAGLTDVKWIPMTGAGPSIQELLSGGLDIVCCSLPEARVSMENNEVRCLGVMSTKRAHGFEEVPTLNELGFDCVVTGWRGLAVPKDTPKAIVEKLESTIAEIASGKVVVDGQSFPSFMDTQGFDLTLQKSQPFRQALAKMDQQFGEILTSPEFRQMSSEVVSPLAFPVIVACGLAGFLGFVVLTHRAQPLADHEDRKIGWNGWLNAALVVGSVVCYVIFAETMGFLVMALLVFLIIATRLGGRISTSLITGIVFVPAVYQIFSYLLRVPLPRGIIDL